MKSTITNKITTCKTIKILSLLIALTLFFCLSEIPPKVLANDGWTEIDAAQLNMTSDLATFPFSVNGVEYTGTHSFWRQNPNTVGRTNVSTYAQRNATIDPSVVYNFTYNFGSSTINNMFFYDSVSANLLIAFDMGSVTDFPIRAFVRMQANGLPEVKVSSILEDSYSTDYLFDVDFYASPDENGIVTYTYDLKLNSDSVVESFESNILHRIDTELSQNDVFNDNVDVKTIGHDLGLYTEDLVTSNLNVYFPRVWPSQNGADSFDSGAYSMLDEYFGGASENFSKPGLEIDDRPFGETVVTDIDSAIFHIWRGRTISKEKNVLLSYRVGLSIERADYSPDIDLLEKEISIYSDNKFIETEFSWSDLNSNEIEVFTKIDSVEVSLGKYYGSPIVGNSADLVLNNNVIDNIFGTDYGVSTTKNVVIYARDLNGNLSNEKILAVTLLKSPEIDVYETDVSVVKGNPLKVSGASNYKPNEGFLVYMNFEDSGPIEVTKFITFESDGTFKLNLPAAEVAKYFSETGKPYTVYVYAVYDSIPSSFIPDRFEVTVIEVATTVTDQTVVTTTTNSGNHVATGESNAGLTILLAILAVSAVVIMVIRKRKTN